MKQAVLKIAQDKPYVRGCYWRLYFEYCIEQGVCFTSKRSGYFLPYKHLDDMPSPESVSRTYRKLCETHTEIRPDDTIKEFRFQNQEEMEHINEWFPCNSKQSRLVFSGGE